MSEKIKKPLIFTILLIIAAISAVVSAVLITLGTIQVGKFNSGEAMIGIYLIPVAVVTALIGFVPEMHRMAVRTERYMQQQTKDDKKQMANTKADISSEAISTTTRAIKEGLKDTKYCPHCGEKIPADSKFCKKCGKEQD